MTICDPLKLDCTSQPWAIHIHTCNNDQFVCSTITYYFTAESVDILKNFTHGFSTPVCPLKEIEQNYQWGTDELQQNFLNNFTNFSNDCFKSLPLLPECHTVLFSYILGQPNEGEDTQVLFRCDNILSGHFNNLTVFLFCYYERSLRYSAIEYYRY